MKEPDWHTVYYAINAKVTSVSVCCTVSPSKMANNKQ